MSELVVTGHCGICGAQVVDGDPSCGCWDPYEQYEREPEEDQDDERSDPRKAQGKR